MENRNDYDPNLRYPVTPEPKSSAGNWVVAVVVAVALVAGIGFYNHRTTERNLSDISPAAGTSAVVKDSTTYTASPSDDTGALPATNTTLDNMPPQPTPYLE